MKEKVVFHCLRCDRVFEGDDIQDVLLHYTGFGSNNSDCWFKCDKCGLQWDTMARGHNGIWNEKTYDDRGPCIKKRRRKWVQADEGCMTVWGLLK